MMHYKPFPNMIHKLFNPMLVVLTLLIEIALFCSCQNSSFISCIESERQTLLKLKQSFEDPFQRLSSWKGNNCCIWKGVSCDETNGHVVKLNLRAPPRFINNSFYGIISQEFSSLVAPRVNSCLLELRYLEHLDMSGNNFQYSPIPQIFSSMKQLRYLNISNARFDGTVPNNLGNLTGLRVLDLSCKDQGPQWALRADDDVQWISKLASLQHLGMAGIHLGMAGIYLGDTRNLFQVLKMLPSLSSLHLSQCALGNSHLFWHPVNSTFRSLRHLDLGQNNFVGTVPSMIQNMTSLRFLDLSYNLLTSSIQDSFGNFKNHVHLNLAANDFSSIKKGLLLVLGNMCHLKSLDLSYNQLKGEQIGNYRNLSGCFGHYLEALNLDYARISGYIPDWLGMLVNLKHLHLSQNQLNGTVPESLGQLSQLETLDLSQNSLEGTISEVHFASLSKLKMLSIGSNSLSMKIKSNWVPPFQLDYIEMGSCKFGTKFPEWLKTQLKATTLVLSNASISGNLPEWIKDMNLYELDLSHNQIKGTLPTFPSNFHHVDLSDNSISGVIPESISDMLPQLRSLILSDNLLNGSIPNSLCLVKTMIVLELSKNNLSWKIPDCWRHHQDIEVLDLSSNKLSGVIPSSIGHLDSLRWFLLSNNILHGELPLALKNCTSLRFLDLGQNALSGNVPKWIGDSFQFLRVLRLRENEFNGSIPSQLCQLSTDLRILDLADNNLKGTIPHCFYNLTAMVLPQTNVQILESYKNLLFWEEEHLSEVIKGRYLEYTRTLQFLVGIDLSRNKLEGLIPEEVTLLTGLIALNLSYNQLSGKIPRKIGELESLESLDLSVNQLSGVIPDCMSSMTKLSYLNLSYNNFSGQIPKGNQLQTLDDPSIYAGNPLLCGTSLLQKCLDDDHEPRQGNQDEGKDNPAEQMWFYIVIMSGFATGFWGVVGVLIFKKGWRHAYFLFVDKSKDWVLVLVEIKMASIRNIIRVTA